jgi:hypothetical protein
MIEQGQRATLHFVGCLSTLSFLCFDRSIFGFAAVTRHRRLDACCEVSYITTVAARRSYSDFFTSLAGYMLS